MAELSEGQVTELSAYLSSPGSIPASRPTPTSIFIPARAGSSSSSSSLKTAEQLQEEARAHAQKLSKENPLGLPASQRPSAGMDPLRSLLIESDLRRQMQGNILHHKTVGSYKGRRHAGGFPVHGQRTQSNAQTARKLNRVERRQMSTLGASAGASRVIAAVASALPARAATPLGPVTMAVLRSHAFR